MDIFLTGSNGFIGKHLFKKLLSYGHNVYTRIEELRMMPFDVVIHLAAVTHTRSEFDPKIFESNIVLTKEVLSTPYRTLYASSCSAAHLTNPYAYTKRYAEWLGSIHPNSLGFRFFNVYGPGNNKGILWMLNQKKNGDHLVLRGPDIVRDYVYVDDVVDEIVSNLRTYSAKTTDHPPSLSVGMSKNTGLIDVGTCRGVRTIDLVRIYQNISGKSFSIEVEPAGKNEPLEMISSRSIPHIKLEQGIVKMLQIENQNK